MIGEAATINLPIDPSVNFAMIMGLGVGLVVLGIRLGGMISRLLHLEAREKVLTELLRVLSDAVTATRFDMQKGYAPIEYMRTVEKKIDHLGDQGSELKSTMAAQGATLDAIQESLRDMKAR